MADGNNNGERGDEPRRSTIDRRNGDSDAKRDDDRAPEERSDQSDDSSGTRRSLDRRQRRDSEDTGDTDAPPDSPPPDDDFGDEKTMLVDVDDMTPSDSGDGDAHDQSPGAEATSSTESKGIGEPSTAPETSDIRSHSPNREPSESADDLPPPATSNSSADHGSGRSDQPTPPSGGSAHQEAQLDLDDDGDDFDDGGGQQMVVPGDGGADDFDEETEFVNLDDFADDGPSDSSTPDPPDDSVRLDPTGEVSLDDVEEATSQSQSSGSRHFSPGGDDPGGFDENTEFVNINELTEQNDAPDAQIRNDEVLRSGYDFSDQGIECHDGANIVWAQNPIGKPVVLRQVWSGDPQQMPADLRDRVATLDDLDIDGLLSMEGLFTSESGCWVEMSRPTGHRLGVLLKQHGTFDDSQTKRLVEGTAAILEDLQAHNFVYANLCPDAIWLEDDWRDTDDPRDGITLEPFDILALGDRSRLGHFAPRELQAAENRDDLTPATDVFGLSAIATAALTGLPLNADRLDDLEDEGLAEALQTGLADAPSDRQTSPGELADAVAGDILTTIRDAAVDLADEPVRLGIALMAVASLVVLGVMYVPTLLGGSSPPPSANAAGSAAAPPGGTTQAKTKTKTSAQPKGTKSDRKNPKSAAQGAGTDDQLLAKEELPDSIESHDKLQIKQSYRTNPPQDDSQTMSDEERKQTLDSLRSDIQSILDEADELRGDSKQKSLEKGLRKSAEAIALQDGDPAQQDVELRNQLFEYDHVQTYYSDTIERTQKYLMDESLGEARFPFQTLTDINPRARSGGFFDQPDVQSVDVVERVGAKTSDKKDGSNEESQ